MANNNSFWFLLLGGFVLTRKSTTQRGPAPSPSFKSGTWMRPIDTIITQPFGITHNGVDLRATPGTNIHAPANGVVKDLYTNSLGGLQMIILHDNHYLTGYAHLNNTLVSKGDRVDQGQVIALSGNTGHTTGPHLHFTVVNPSGTPINPVGVIY